MNNNTNNTNNTIMHHGDTAVCNCGPQSPPPDIPGAAGLVTMIPPPMIRLSSGENVPVLQRQRSRDTTVSREQKLLSWIKSKSAWTSNCRIGVPDRLAGLQETMISDFKEWKLLFCSGEGPKKYIVTKNLPKQDKGEKDFTLTKDDRTRYCEILDTQLDSNSDDYTIKYIGKDDANNSFIHCGFPPLPPLLPPSPDVTKEVKQSREDRMVLLVARDEYREWWINKHTSQVVEDGYTISKQDENLNLYWDLLQGQTCSHTGSFNDFFLLEKKVETAIELLINTPSKEITVDLLAKLERQTSISGLIAILGDNEEGESKEGGESKESKEGGYRKRKSKGGGKWEGAPKGLAKEIKKIQKKIKILENNVNDWVVPQLNINMTDITSNNEDIARNNEDIAHNKDYYGRNRTALLLLKNIVEISKFDRQALSKDNGNEIRIIRNYIDYKLNPTAASDGPTEVNKWNSSKHANNTQPQPLPPQNGGKRKRKSKKRTRKKKGGRKTRRKRRRRKTKKRKTKKRKTNRKRRKIKRKTKRKR